MLHMTGLCGGGHVAVGSAQRPLMLPLSLTFRVATVAVAVAAAAQRQSKASLLRLPDG
jgi:hypothetical protein